MIIALKTDSENSEIYLLNSSGQIQSQKIWPAGRTLASDLLGEIDELVGKDFAKLSGIIVFKGPGSFTGLRIGITTANALAYSQNLPIVGTNGANWLDDGANRLTTGQNDKIVLPEYGAPANITKPKK